MKTVEHVVDTLPKLTEAQRKRLDDADAMTDAQIDTADLPELTDAQSARMEQGRFYRPVKQQITARLDADVLAWLKSQGKGYQTRMNAILRREMMAALKSSGR
jgi:uncharacterized protein (DUF4415 family)